MTILHIEHPVADFSNWKKAFDSDPVDRKKSGVRRYQILRPVSEPNYVMIDLEFDSPTQAQALLDAMRLVWERVGPQGLIGKPEARILEAVEVKQLS